MADVTRTVVPALPLNRSHPFDPPPEQVALCEQEPLARLKFLDGHIGWLVTGYDVARAILADDRFGTWDYRHHPLYDGPPYEVPWAQGWFIELDPPEHGRFRRLLTADFTMRGLAWLAPRIEQVVAERIDAMREHGAPVDLVSTFALPVPSIVICELLGVPYTDREAFHTDTHMVLDANLGPDDFVGAMLRLQSRMTEQVQLRRDQPGDDMISMLVREGSLTDLEVANIALLMVIAGHVTTAHMLSMGAFALLRHPDQLARLRAEPELLNSAVEELLRYITLFQQGVLRIALQDMEFAGQSFRAGDTLVVSLAPANRDPARFPEPDRLDLGRQARGHLSFGHGIHKCLGQELARMELRIGLRALLAAFPGLRLAVEPSEVPMGSPLMAFHTVDQLPVAW